MVGVRDQHFGEFEQMTDAWKADGWGAHYRQLEPGPFRGRMLQSAVGSSVIYRARWESVVQHQGLQPKGTIGLAATLSSRGQGRFLGEVIGPHDMVIQASETPLELRGAEMWEAGVLVLPQAELAGELAAITQRDPRPVLEHQGLARIDPARSARIRGAYLQYFDALEQSLTAKPQGTELAGMARQLVSQVVSALAASRITPLPTPDARRRRQIVRKTEEYAAGCDAARLRIADVCRAVGVCERSLRYAFRDLLDTTPTAYLKSQRLNRAHHALREADPSRVLVKQVAYANGFWHLGQFAADYRRLFGESPSETLASG